MSSRSTSSQLLCRFSFILLFSIPGMLFAGPSTKVILSEKSLTVSDGSFDPIDNIEEFRKKYKTEEDRKLGLLISKSIDSFAVEMAFEQELTTKELRKDRAAFNKALKDYTERFQSILKNHLEETLAKYPSSKEEKFGATIYTIDRGIEFWIDLVTHPDPERRVAGLVFLGRPFAEESMGLSGNFVESLVHEFKQSTRIIRVDLFTHTEWSQILKLARHEGYLMSRHGDYVLLGAGHSFLLANDIFSSAEKLKDPVLQARFDEVTEFLALKGIDIQVDEHQGAAAFFSPTENRMAYVMPSRSDLDTHTHEGTHARFNQFQKHFRHWADHKGYAVPYEVDGPAIGLMMDFGGFMNLLNELNSWRVGTSFSTPMSDAEILKVLQDSYGRQAGKEAAELFGTIWTPEVTSGRAVPKMILAATRSLNKLPSDNLQDFGQSSLSEKNEVQQHNFIRLVYARYKEKELPRELQHLLEQISLSGATKTVQGSAKSILDALLSSKDDDGSSTRISKEYTKKVDTWLKTLETDQIKVIPFEFKYRYNITLYHAVEHNLQDYDQVISQLKQAFGDRNVNYDPVEKTVFDKILQSPGQNFSEKLIAHLVALNNQGFSVLWNEFLKKPEYDTMNLLEESHSQEFRAEHFLELLKICLDQSRDQYDQDKALKLLSGIYEKNGFETIYDINDFDSLVRMQKSMNQQNGKPEDYAIPKKRLPQPGSMMVDATLDRFLSESMFDGKPGVYRIELINFLRSHTYPSELPLLRDRITTLLTSDDKNLVKEDLWVARMFMVPEKEILYHSHISWAQHIAESIFRDKTPSITALEFAAEYYRLAVSKVLDVSRHFVENKGQMDSQVRTETVALINKMSPRDKYLVDRAATDLWPLLIHENERVRKAARYALGTNPAFLISVQKKIEGALRANKSKYRQEAFHLVAFTQPGFFPKIDILLKTTAKTLKKDEKELLTLRNPPSEKILRDQKVFDLELRLNKCVRTLSVAN